MIDISIRKDNPDRAVAYLDGADARVYRMLVSRLGSEEAAQNAVMLYGLISKLKATEDRQRVLKLFPKFAGASYKKIDLLLEEFH